MLADIAYIRSLGINIEDGKLDPFMGQASSKMKEWIDENDYKDAESDSPDDSDRAQKLKIAESYLTLYYALPFLNIKINEKLIQKVQSINGTSVERTSMRDMESLQNWFYQRAVEFSDEFTEFEHKDFRMMDI